MSSCLSDELEEFGAVLLLIVNKIKSTKREASASHRCHRCKVIIQHERRKVREGLL